MDEYEMSVLLYVVTVVVVVVVVVVWEYNNVKI